MRTLLPFCLMALLLVAPTVSPILPAAPDADGDAADGEPYRWLLGGLLDVEGQVRVEGTEGARVFEAAALRDALLSRAEETGVPPQPPAGGPVDVFVVETGTEVTLWEIIEVSGGKSDLPARCWDGTNHRALAVPNPAYTQVTHTEHVQNVATGAEVLIWLKGGLHRYVGHAFSGLSDHGDAVLTVRSPFMEASAAGQTAEYPRSRFEYRTYLHYGGTSDFACFVISWPPWPGSDPTTTWVAHVPTIQSGFVRNVRAP